MTRYLKALGLALGAVFAFSAVAVSSASAQEGKLTSDGPVTLTGTETGETLDNSFTAFGSSIHCPGATYTGHKVNTTDPHEFIPSGATAITVTPDYGDDCINDDGDPITVDMRDCDYAFTNAETDAAGNGTYAIDVGIDCDASSGILVTGGACTVRVPPQAHLTGLHATNQAGGHIKISGTVHSITAVACGFLHTNSAEQHQSVTIEGHNEVQQPTAVELSH